RPPEIAADTAEATHEIVDHPVRVRVVGIESIELAVGWKIDARLPLRGEDDAGGIDQRLFAWKCREPFGDRIGADGRCEDRKLAGNRELGLLVVALVLG